MSRKLNFGTNRRVFLDMRFKPVPFSETVTVTRSAHIRVQPGHGADRDDAISVDPASVDGLPRHVRSRCSDDWLLCRTHELVRTLLVPCRGSDADRPGRGHGRHWRRDADRRADHPISQEERLGGGRVTYGRSVVFPRGSRAWG